MSDPKNTEVVRSWFTTDPPELPVVTPQVDMERIHEILRRASKRGPLTIRQAANERRQREGRYDVTE